jgi:hypothetical protein
MVAFGFVWISTQSDLGVVTFSAGGAGGHFCLLRLDRLAEISPDGEVLVADAGSLPCGRLFRPMGELLFIAIKSNQKALARFRSKARLKSRRPRRKRNSHGWASHD